MASLEPKGRNFIPLIGPDMPPGSLARPAYELVDVFGDGLPDVLQMHGTVRYSVTGATATSTCRMR